MENYRGNFILTEIISFIILIIIFSINIVTNSSGVLSIIGYISTVLTIVISIVSLFLLRLINVSDFNRYWFNILNKISIGLIIISLFVICIDRIIYLYKNNRTEDIYGYIYYPSIDMFLTTNCVGIMLILIINKSLS